MDKEKIIKFIDDFLDEVGNGHISQYDDYFHRHEEICIFHCTAIPEKEID